MHSDIRFLVQLGLRALIGAEGRSVHIEYTHTSDFLFRGVEEDSAITSLCDDCDRDVPDYLCN